MLRLEEKNRNKKSFKHGAWISKIKNQNDNQDQGF